MCTTGAAVALPAVCYICSWRDLKLGVFWELFGCRCAALMFFEFSGNSKTCFKVRYLWAVIGYGAHRTKRTIMLPSMEFFYPYFLFPAPKSQLILRRVLSLPFCLDFCLPERAADKARHE